MAPEEIEGDEPGCVVTQLGQWPNALLGIGIVSAEFRLISMGPNAGRRAVSMLVTVSGEWWKRGSSAFYKVHALIERLHPHVYEGARKLVVLVEETSFAEMTAAGGQQFFDFLLASPSNLVFELECDGAIPINIPGSRVHLSIWPTVEKPPCDAMLNRADSLVIQYGEGGFQSLPPYAREFIEGRRRPVYLTVKIAPATSVVWDAMVGDCFRYGAILSLPQLVLPEE